MRNSVGSARCSAAGTGGAGGRGSLLGATFWTPGTAGIVSVDRPCVVMLRRAGE
ncbi:polysaccharide lyase beta-sandwich domain-containing protein, partial [Nonomuraea fuscirosea]